ncbi:DUF1552 domain-containing protein [Rubripirellula reticaptiva]|uniref:Secreted protein containing DUF1552 n=1 Tax=Rubripirellula reticaptiva TaxID=2528013 RepID=A0A5C6EE31_9BACT|nr:DUF1552 domain-containing protein [Rubripirellula reticaptiva]TWU47098.1 hypothetical protein Poly59_60720 [Rubripirellula reticaptiva]
MPISRSPRRNFLKAAGISIALPAFESRRVAAASKNDAGPPKRMVCVGNEFGMYPGSFWPEDEQSLSPLLEPLANHRKNFTLFSHLDHDLNGGHFAVHTFLTGVKAVEAKSLPDGGISLDQRAAEHVGSQTRFPSLTVGSESGLHGGCRMSWTRTGTRVPPIEGPRELFRMLFIDNDSKAKAAATNRISLQESILDAVLGDANSLARRLNPSDKNKLDEYLSSVRAVELKLELDRRWQKVPKPKPSIDEPTDQGLTRDLPKIYDLIALALQTDSTRVATVEVGGSFAASDLGIKKGYHGLSHHGQVQENIDLLVQIERYQVEQFARFLDRLDSMRDASTDQTLLESTSALFGSGMGNANSHTNHDLPIVLAGGGFKHQAMIDSPSAANRRVPLSNLFVSMLQQFGVETDSFAKSTGTLTGLRTA